MVDSVTKVIFSRLRLVLDVAGLARHYHILQVVLKKCLFNWDGEAWALLGAIYQSPWNGKYEYRALRNTDIPNVPVLLLQARLHYLNTFQAN